jgi:general secretion pathway protein C
MLAMPFDRSNFSQRVLVMVVTIAAVTTFSLVAAYWTWNWFAPRPEWRAQGGAGNSGGAAGTLFGAAAKERNAAAPTGIAIRLLGIVAATAGRKGYAVMEVEPRQILAVHEGDDVAPGIRLAEVEPDHVTLDRNGRQETLTWPEKSKPAEPAPVRTNR